MKKKLKISILALAIPVIGMLSLSSVFADCPATDCDDECASGETCSITQYDENGNLCSWTICSGYGADFGETLEP